MTKKKQNEAQGAAAQENTTPQAEAKIPRFTIQGGEENKPEYAWNEADLQTVVEKLKKARTPEFLVIDQETHETMFFVLPPGWKNYKVTTAKLEPKTDTETPEV